MNTTFPPPLTLPVDPVKLQELIDLCEAEKDDMIRRFWLCDAAAKEDSFSGTLRRAVHSGGMRLDQLATKTEMDVIALGDFLEGTRELTSPQIDRLVATLGLQLMRPITNEATKPKPRVTREPALPPPVGAVTPQ